jgi:predicted amidohydrolase YtcJ
LPAHAVWPSLSAQVDPTKDLEETVFKHWKNGTLQVAAHVLGDGAVELMIRAMEKAAAAQGPTTKRHQLQHAALVRPDQIARIAKLGAALDFTAGPIYLVGAPTPAPRLTPQTRLHQLAEAAALRALQFAAHADVRPFPPTLPPHLAPHPTAGDYFEKLFGPERMKQVMPAASALKAGIPVALNTDYPAVRAAGAARSVHCRLGEIWSPLPPLMEHAGLVSRHGRLMLPAKLPSSKPPPHPARAPGPACSCPCTTSSTAPSRTSASSGRTSA